MVKYVMVSELWSYVASTMEKELSKVRDEEFSVHSTDQVNYSVINIQNHVIAIKLGQTNVLLWK